mgnify:CR=1 FL=1
MPTMVCVQCGQFMKIKKNGVAFEEGIPSGRNGEWKPYKLWMADLYKCQGCGAEIIAGLGANPIAEHYQFDYESAKERYAPIIIVNDCPGSYKPEVDSTDDF